jgi:hypothetical protein
MGMATKTVSDIAWDRELEAGRTCRLWWRVNNTERGVTGSLVDVGVWISGEYPITIGYSAGAIEFQVTLPVGAVPLAGVYVQLELGESDGMVALLRLRAAATAYGRQPVPVAANAPIPAAVIVPWGGCRVAPAPMPRAFAALLPARRRAGKRTSLSDNLIAAGGPALEVRKYRLAADDGTPFGAWYAAIERFDYILLPYPPQAPHRATLEPIQPLTADERERVHVATDLRLVTAVALRDAAAADGRSVALPNGYLRAQQTAAMRHPYWPAPGSVKRAVDMVAGARYMLAAITDEALAAPPPAGTLTLRTDAVVCVGPNRSAARPLVCVPMSESIRTDFLPNELRVPAGYDCVAQEEWRFWTQLGPGQVSVTVTTEPGWNASPIENYLWHVMAAAGETAWWPRLAQAFDESRAAVWGVLTGTFDRNMDSGLLGMSGASSNTVLYGRFTRYTDASAGVLDFSYDSSTVVDKRFVLHIPTESIQYVCEWAITYLSDAEYAQSRILQSSSCPAFAFLVFPLKWARLAEAQKSWYEWSVCDETQGAVTYRRMHIGAVGALGVYLQNDVRCSRWLRSRLPAALGPQTPVAHTARIPRVRAQPHRKPTEE